MEEGRRGRRGEKGLCVDSQCSLKSGPRPKDHQTTKAAERMYTKAVSQPRRENPDNYHTKEKAESKGNGGRERERQHTHTHTHAHQGCGDRGRESALTSHLLKSGPALRTRNTTMRPEAMQAEKLTSNEREERERSHGRGKEEKYATFREKKKRKRKST